MKTFLALGLKPQAQVKEKQKKKEEKKEEKKEKKKQKKKKDKKKKDSSTQKDAAAQTVKSKPSEEKEKRKKRLERSLSPIFEEGRINKRRLLKLAEKTSSSSKAEDKESAITVEPMSVTAPAQQPTIKGASQLEEREVLWLRSFLLKKNKKNKLKQRLQMIIKTLNTSARVRRR